MVNTVVIGAGQAGLAMGHQLRRRGREFVIVDEGNELGLSWRKRWDSLRLFTPASFNHLPGMEFPAARAESPRKDAMADYLSSYAKRFQLPVELNTRIESVQRQGADLLVGAADGRQWRAANVVVATGAHSRPVIPEVAGELDGRIEQLHAGDYRRPGQLPGGQVLVVGAGNSGAEIVLELAMSGDRAPRRQVYLAGRDVGYLPPLGTWTFPLLQLSGRVGSVLSRRALRDGAEALARIRPGDLEGAGIQRLPRIVGVSDGLPVADDGTRVAVDAVVWCTGFRPDHGFLQVPGVDPDRLVHRRGVTDEPGLYVLGMPHQSSITSHLVGGSARTRHISPTICACPSPPRCDYPVRRRLKGAAT